MNGQYNIWNKWDKLETVMLGDCYAPEFFRDIKNPRIRSALDRIATETKEDLENYEKVLRDFGCVVIRPQMLINESIMDHINDEGAVRGSQGVPKAPLQPRDAQMVIGNSLMITSSNDHKSILKELQSYNKKDIKILDIGGALVSAPSFTLIGKDLYIDRHPLNNVTDRHISILSRQYPDIRLNTLNIGGHNDGSFHVLKEGIILTLYDIQHYSETFPGWEICYLQNQSWNGNNEFLKMKEKVSGKWWVPGEEDNDEFTFFVETWLKDWVGYCEETVFDVNVLMLDKHHVCVSSYNKIAFEFFKKHHIEPIIVPWRHRFFWDGGLHCITLDLYREGHMEDYFPQRTESINDLGFD